MLFNFGLDWLTLTNIITEEEPFPALMPVFQEQSGAVKKWSAGGYQGMRDPDSGLKYGSRRREDGRVEEMLIAPGKTAEPALDIIDFPLSYRATRVDLQMTVQLFPPDANLASDLYEVLVKSRESGENIAKRRKVVLVQSSTGQTLYLGRRKTARKFFRLYDKSEDDGAQMGKFWRQEVQYGRDLAEEALKVYFSIKDDPAAICSLVCAEFQDAMSYSLLTHAMHPSEIVSGSPKSAIKLGEKLEWLRTCVRPTIALMIDNDLEQEMLRALGLRESRPPRTGKPSSKFIRHVLRANKILTDDEK